MQWVPAPVPKVFEFFSNEKNLETLTPSWLHFHVVGKSTPKLQTGTLINYQLKVRGVPIRWQSRIEEWEEGKKFVDTQVVGPYRTWHHTHTFEPLNEGTLMKDTIRYEVPGGSWGEAIAGPFVDNDVKKIFEFRQKTISKIFPSRPE